MRCPVATQSIGLLNSGAGGGGNPLSDFCRGCVRFPQRGAPIEGCFRLHSLPRQDFFCRIRENFCPCFPVKQKTGPVCISQAETGPEIYLFMPLWATEVGAGWAFGRGAWWKGVRNGVSRGQFFLKIHFHFYHS